jgi:pyruvate/2-oxoglutarate dehydrogenase complex dihydrolipoamide acyltransferase (E2) component
VPKRSTYCCCPNKTKLRTVLDIIRALLSAKPAPHKELPYSVMRNVVLDIMAEGRRKNTIHLLFEADATAMDANLASLNATRETKISVTSYLAKVLADTVAESPLLQAYRKGSKQLIVFDDVDVSVMVERRVDGFRMPVPYIVRAMNQKPVDEINALLRRAQTAPLYTSQGPLSDLEAAFFRLPGFVRRIAWFFIRRDPHLFRQVAGTVGLTSLPAQLSTPAIGQPITPMTLTLLVGAISPRAVILDGVAVEKQFIQFNLAADHDVVDGAQMMRFMESFKRRLAQGPR